MGVVKGQLGGRKGPRWTVPFRHRMAEQKRMTAHVCPLSVQSLQRAGKPGLRARRECPGTNGFGFKPYLIE